MSFTMSRSQLVDILVVTVLVCIVVSPANSLCIYLAAYSYSLEHSRILATFSNLQFFSHKTVSIELYLRVIHFLLYMLKHCSLKVYIINITSLALRLRSLYNAHDSATTYYWYAYSRLYDTITSLRPQAFPLRVPIYIMGSTTYSRTLYSLISLYFRIYVQFGVQSVVVVLVRRYVGNLLS